MARKLISFQMNWRSDHWFAQLPFFGYLGGEMFWNFSMLAHFNKLFIIFYFLSSPVFQLPKAAPLNLPHWDLGLLFLGDTAIS